MADEWLTLIEKYPKVAFNYRNFSGEYNSPEKGFEILVHAEPWTMFPQQWDLSVMSQYQGVITYNPVIYEMYKHVVPMKLMDGCLFCNFDKNWMQTKDFIDYEEKIKKIIILNKIYQFDVPGSLLWIRPEFVNNSPIDVDVWSHVRWGGDHYKGVVDTPYHHSHVNHLKKLNEYKFCVCFESTYHRLWSQGFMTERLFNCFKAKTLPVYMGCWNIEDYVPTDLFVDFRKYHGATRDYQGIADKLNSISKQQYIDMTEKAYEWVHGTEIGSTTKLQELIKEF